MSAIHRHRVPHISNTLIYLPRDGLNKRIILKEIGQNGKPVDCKDVDNWFELFAVQYKASLHSKCKKAISEYSDPKQRKEFLKTIKQSVWGSNKQTAKENKEYFRETWAAMIDKLQSWIAINPTPSNTKKKSKRGRKTKKSVESQSVLNSNTTSTFVSRCGIALDAGARMKRVCFLVE